MKKILISITLVLSLFMFVLPAAVIANGITTVYDQDWSGWQNAVVYGYATESFEDAILNPGVSVVTDLGYVDTTKGVWWDRLVVPLYGQTTTVWQFDKPILAFGGTWNPGGPGGPGANIAVSINGSWISVGVIPRTYVNVFWGFVSSVPFTEVRLESDNPNEGWCETYELDNMVYSLARGVQITLPSDGETFWITNQTVSGEVVPVMPSIKCQAILFGFTQNLTLFTKFSWEAHVEYLHYLYVGENNGDYTYSAETQTGTKVGAGNGNCIQICDESDTIMGKSVGTGFWIPSFRSMIMGGVLKIKVKATVLFNEYSDEITVRIRGENPSRQAIRDRLDKPIYQVICYKESSPKWHQFYAAGDSIRGLPVCAFDCGYGLMQITYPNPTVPQIWDWRENIDRGKEMFDYKYDVAKTYIDTLISDMKTTDKEEAKKMKKSFPKYGYEREACCRYRGGHYYCWDAVNDTWIRDPSSPFPNSQNYADDAISILAGIEAEPPSFPENW